jgi:hypothetical protein
MTRVTVDRALRAKLNNLVERLELCDEAGYVLGYFVPASETEEELQRRREQQGKRSLADILDDLTHL